MLTDFNITPLTTFGIPAKARFFAEYSSVKELKQIMQSPQYKESNILHIGGGSNLLFTDYYNGLILRSAIKGMVKYKKDDSTSFAIVAAGESWDDFVQWTIEQQMSGIENLSGIPGQAGASAVQNVGAYGVEASDYIHSVEAIDAITGEIKVFKANECAFAYRDSIFKNQLKNRFFILRVCFRLRNSSLARHLSYGPLKALQTNSSTPLTTSQIRNEIIKIRNSKLPDPAKIGSAGSFFKNPIIDKYFFEEIVKPVAPLIPCFPVGDNKVKISAAWLIDHANLKGHKIGGAQVWPSQCLVIANTNHASASDVIQLSNYIQAQVNKKFFVSLQPEVNFISSAMHITILGSGTSKGVPEIGCQCDVCTSSNPADKRLRSSILIETQGINILVDPSPDFRQQALTHNITHIDAILITHEHYDHVGGLDDLRPFCVNSNLNIYAQANVINAIRRRLDYCFRENPYPGVPVFKTHEISHREPLYIKGVKIQPIQIMHGKLSILGFRIGDFAYITDASEIPDYELPKLSNLQVLILNALRHKPHFAHFSLSQALDIINNLKPKQAWLTHLSHEMGKFEEKDPKLPQNVHFATDNLKITIP